jgi:hypothetical protein
VVPHSGKITAAFASNQQLPPMVFVGVVQIRANACVGSQGGTLKLRKQLRVSGRSAEISRISDIRITP